MRQPNELPHGPASPVSLLALSVAAALAAPAAQAGVAAPPPTERASSVDTDIIDIGGGEERFDYTLNNDSPFDPYGGGAIPLIVDWELPWFVDGGIDEGSILSPGGWDHAIETVGEANPETGWGGIADWQTPGDPFYNFLNDLDADGNPIDNGLTEAQETAFLEADQVLHWFIAPDFFDASGCSGPVASGIADADCGWGWDGTPLASIRPSGALGGPSSLGGFGFEAPASTALAAPFQASWFDLPVQTGDPPFPGEPAGFRAPTSGLPSQPVPAPTTLALAGLGLAGLAWRRRRR